MMTSGRFWNRQYIDFLLKVGDLSISDPLELASMMTMTSPAGESLWNLCAQYHGQTSRGYTWVGHTLVRRELWNQSIRLHGPADSLLTPYLHGSSALRLLRIGDRDFDLAEGTSVAAL